MSDETCHDCSLIDNDCEDCDTETTCIDCSGDLIPQFGGATCVQEQDNCSENDPSDFTKCKTCDDNFGLMDDKSCFDCQTIDGSCVDCDTETTCSDCSGSLVPQVDFMSCVQPASNCEYPNESDSRLCQLCLIGFDLLDDYTCYDCSLIDANCAGCDTKTTCYNCGSTMIPQFD